MNVVIHRLPLDQSVVKPRSSCPKCQAKLKWYDNIPVLSYLILRGKCRSCSKKISIQYPLVELMVSLLFLATYLKFGFSWVLVVRDWPFVASLVAVAFIDLKHRIIPDEFSIGGTVLGLATAYFVPSLGLVSALTGAITGFGIFYLFAWAYEKFSGRVGLGGGDIKLMAAFGAFLGPVGVFYTLFLSSVFGSVIGISWAVLQGQKNIMKSAIPYGPFLVLGALMFYLLGDFLLLQSTIPM